MPKDACEPVSGMKSPTRVASGSSGDCGSCRGSGVGAGSTLLGVEACGGAPSCGVEAGACGGDSEVFGGEAAATSGGEAGATSRGEAGATSRGGTGACSGRTGACRRAAGCCGVEGCSGACSATTLCCSATDCGSAGADGFLLQPVKAKATLKKTSNREVGFTGRSLGNLWTGATELCTRGAPKRQPEIALNAHKTPSALSLIGNPDIALSRVEGLQYPYARVRTEG